MKADESHTATPESFLILVIIDWWQYGQVHDIGRSFVVITREFVFDVRCLCWTGGSGYDISW